MTVTRDRGMVKGMNSLLDLIAVFFIGLFLGILVAERVEDNYGNATTVRRAMDDQHRAWQGYLEATENIERLAR